MPKISKSSSKKNTVKVKKVKTVKKKATAALKFQTHMYQKKLKNICVISI